MSTHPQDRGESYMSKKKKTVKYTDGPLQSVELVEDFLPKPEDLVMKEETVKVTLSLTKQSVDYFKSLAEENQTQYQKMIRTLLDQYAMHYQHRR